MDAPLSGLNSLLYSAQPSALQRDLPITAVVARALSTDTTKNEASSSSKLEIDDAKRKEKILAYINANPIETESVKNDEKLLSMFFQKELDYQSMIEIYNALKTSNAKKECFHFIIQHLLSAQDLPNLNNFLNPFSPSERDALLLDSAHQIVEDARLETANAFTSHYALNLEGFVKFYNQEKNLLIGSVTDVFIVFSLLSDINKKIAFIKRLLASVPCFPQIYISDYPAEYIAKHVNECKLSREHSDLIESSKIKYQKYTEQKTRDYFAGLDGRFVSYYDFLGMEEQDPANPAASAAKACRQIIDRHKALRQSFSEQKEKNIAPIYEFIAKETILIRARIIDLATLVQLSQNDLNGLFCILNAILPEVNLPLALLRVAEISLLKCSMRLFPEIIAEVIRIKDKFNKEEQSTVELIVLQGAVQSLKSGNQKLAADLISLFPDKKDAVLKAASTT